MLNEALNGVVTGLAPSKVLQHTKRYLHRDCHKPVDMKVFIYYHHLMCINDKELPCLPPFGLAQSLSKDEMIDFLLFGMPKSWQKEMDQQGFDPLLNTIAAVVDFMECIEMSEDFNPSKDSSVQKAGGKKKNGKGGSKRSDGQENRQQLCLLHGHRNHSTNDCMKLKAEAKCLKTTKP